ncbi:MAG: DUF6527 family protein [Bacteroidales bacterium]|nr:DUF6527 family protein [Bacteroidales bacterium]
MITNLEHVFLDTIPDELEERKLYISLRFSVIMHSCCCGCKEKVVTPLSPARWKMTFDGKTISLTPSIGNWNSDCQSHYWITNSEIEWARKWTKSDIVEGKMYEREKRKEYFERINILEKKDSFFKKIIRLFK